MRLDDGVISWISGPSPRKFFYKVGEQGVDVITVEWSGPDVQWFTMWNNGKVLRRCNAAMIEEVGYIE